MAGGFPTALFGSVVVLGGIQRRNDMAGGFPAASFGFMVVPGAFGEEITQWVDFPPCRLFGFRAVQGAASGMHAGGGVNEQKTGAACGMHTAPVVSALRKETPSSTRG
jgi:hypothetical protein